MINMSDLVKKDGGLFVKGAAAPQQDELVRLLSEETGFNKLSPDYLAFQAKSSHFRKHTLIGEMDKIPMDITVPGFPEIVSIPRFLIWLETLGFIHKISGNYAEGELTPSPFTKYLTQNELVLKCSKNFHLLEEKVLFDSITLKINKKDYTEIYSKVPGFLSYTGDLLTIIDPIVINKNKTGMIYQFFPLRTGRTDMLDNYYQVLGRHREKYPDASIFVEKDRSLFSQSLPLDYKRSIVVVGGEEAIPGKDAELIINQKARNDEQKKEDQIDYKQQINYSVVEAGELLAIKKKVIKGHDGKDIFGKQISVQKGEDIKVTIKGPIEVITKEKEIEYRSKVLGIFTDDENTLTLDESFVVGGNVDFNTGNINFKGSVLINGDVLSGFKVQSEDNIIIMGGVEDGVEITSRKNINIKKGIFGKRTKITAGKNIQAGFVQEASLYAQENITIAKYAAHSRLVSENSIKILGKGVRPERSSALFGGEAYGFIELDAHSIGSDRCLTRISVGFSPVKEKIKSQLETDINILNREISLISETIPGFIFRKEWERIKLLPEVKKLEIKTKISQIKKYTLTRKELEQKLFALTESIYSMDSNSLLIKIRTVIKGDVAIMIKGYVHNQNEAKHRIRYFLNSGNSIESGPL